MKLKNEFTVRAPVDRAYAVLLDVRRVAPCLPGAALEGRDGDAFNGTMRIKLGPVTSRYRGTVRIEDADDRAHRAVLRAQATDATGHGTAAATITTVMQPIAEGRASPSRRTCGSAAPPRAASCRTSPES